MTTVNKIATCIFCSLPSCQIATCIDSWWGCEACGLAWLNFGKCCWAICSPICFSCQVGDINSAMTYFVDGLKYYVFAILLELVAPLDGIWNMGNFILRCCKSGASSFNDVALQDAHFIADKIKQALSI